MRRLAAFVVLAALEAHAGTLLVPEQYPLVQLAVDAAAPGDTVVIACGRYFEGPIYLRPGLTITSANGDPGCVTFDGNGIARNRTFLATFEAGDPGVVLHGLTFVRAGAGVGVDHAILTLSDCIFESITRTDGLQREGAALVGYFSDVAIRDCSFGKNHATGGGAIYFLASSVEIEACHFYDNTSRWRGGAVWVTGAPTTVTNCSFQGNASFRGGALCLEGSAAIFSGCDFSANSADSGGAVAILEGSPVFTDCKFTENTAMAGGGVFCPRDDVQLVRCHFLANVSSTAGGALMCEYAIRSVTLTGCTFHGNRAPRGGAVHVEGEELLESCRIEDCAFDANTAEDGGACWLAGGTALLKTCRLWNNGADGIGGAVTATGTDLRVAGSTLVANRAHGAGGGIWIAGPLDIRNTIIAYCPSGNAVHRATGSVTSIRCSDFYGNAGGDWTNIEAFRDAYGNLGVDPEFCNTDLEQYTLRRTSPCGPDSSGCALIGALPIGCTLAVERESWGSIKARFR